MIDIMEFRQAMSRLAATVNIIATDGPAGQHGMTASAVCSVSDDPPTLLAGSIATFDCTIESVAEVGTHSVFFGRLVAMRQLHGGTPLLYFNRTFHTSGLPAAA